MRPAERPGRRSQASAAAGLPQGRLLPGLRIRPDLVLTYAPAGMRAKSLAGVAAHVVAADARREIALIASEDGSGAAASPQSAFADFSSAVSVFSGSSYVVAVDAGSGGPSVRPAFIPRLDPVSDSHWTSPLLRIGGDPPVPAGMFLFTVEGRLIGLTVPQAGGVAIATAAMLDTVIVELTGGRQ